MRINPKYSWLIGAIGAFLIVSGTVAAGTILYPYGGGTGTSTPPTTGQLLVGNVGGTYSVSNVVAASTTIGTGFVGLTTNGPATTTGNAVFTGSLGIQIGTSSERFTLSQRRPGVFGFPVFTFRPVTANSVIAGDIMPNGSPADSGFGYAWNDICDTDVLNNGNAVDCLHLSAGANDVRVGSVSYGGATAKPLVFSLGSANGGTEYGRLDTTGNWGFGSTSPWGKVSITGTGIGATPDFVFADSNNSPKVVFRDDGTVGIGTTTPGTQLVIVPNASGGGIRLDGTSGSIGPTYRADLNSTQYLTFGTAGTVGQGVAGSAIGDVFIKNQQAFALLFSTNNTERMRITSAGRVGIATTSPTNTMDVYGGFTVSGVGSGSDPAAGPALSLYWDGTNSNIYSLFQGTAWEPMKFEAATFSFVSGASTQGFFQSSTGSVGIGTTTPSSKLAVSGGASIGADYNFAAPSNGLIIEGNVGIGTASPSNKLSVSGGNITDNGGLFQDQLGGSSYGDVFQGFSGSGDSEVSLGAGAGFGYVGTSGSYNLPFAVQAHGSTVATFMTNGNVGIGTTNPKTTLQVSTSTIPSAIPAAGQYNGASLFVSTSDPSYGTLFGTISNGNGYIQQQRTDGTATTYNLLLQPNGGNVGIATSSPATTGLSVSGNEYLTGALGIGAVNTNVGLLVAAGAPTGTMTTQGLGFGTSGNFAAQEMFGTSGTFMDFSGTSGRDYDFRQIFSPGSNLYQFNSSSTSAILNLLGNGNVGIGVASPGYKLEVSGTGGLGMTGNASGGNFSITDSVIETTRTDGLYLMFSNSSKDINFQNGKAVFKGTGNVGIGTSSPWRTLSVTGTAAINGLSTFATGDSAVCQRAGGELTVDSGVSSCIVSSKYVKKNIVSYDTQSALSRILALNPVSFIYKDTNKKDLGLIAEDAAKVDPRYAQYTDVAKDVDGHHFNAGDPTAINWSAITTDLVQVVQTQQGKVAQAARSAEENWQWTAIVCLLGWNMWLTICKRK